VRKDISESELQVPEEGSTRRGTGTYQRWRDCLPRGDLRQDKQRRKPAPRQEPRAQVMPKRNKREDEDAGGCEAPRAAERDVEVPYDPEVVRAVPCAPETERRVVIRHAADHVLGWVQPVRECP
jgi:hypothetical protein